MNRPQTLGDWISFLSGAASEGKEILSQAQGLLEGASSAGKKAGDLAHLLEGNQGLGVPFEVVVYLLDQALQSAIGKMRVTRAHVEREGPRCIVVVTYRGGGQDEIFVTENLQLAKLGAAVILAWRDYGGAT